MYSVSLHKTQALLGTDRSEQHKRLRKMLMSLTHVWVVLASHTPSSPDPTTAFLAVCETFVSPVLLKPQKRSCPQKPHVSY